MNGQNLLPKHRRDAWKLRRAISAWTMGLGVLAMLVGGLVLGSFMTQAQPQAMPAGLTEKLDLDKSELALLRAQVQAFRQADRARRAAMATPRWDNLLAVLSHESNGRVRLQTIAVRPDPAQAETWLVSIAGSAGSREASAEFAAQLEATGLFSNVRHTLSPAQPGTADSAFGVECVISPGGTP
jgi:Tfp pilus assembly protein PilN